MHQALLVAQELEDLAILLRALQAILQALDDLVDLVQPAQIRLRHRPQNDEEETRRLGGVGLALQLVRKIAQQLVGRHPDGGHPVVVDHDTHRRGPVGRVPPFAGEVGHSHQGQQGPVLLLDKRDLIRVERVVDEIAGNAELLQGGDLVVGWIDDVDPTPRGAAADALQP